MAQTSKDGQSGMLSCMIFCIIIMGMVESGIVTGLTCLTFLARHGRGGGPHRGPQLGGMVTHSG